MNKKILLVTNRSAGMVVYNIPEEGIRRVREACLSQRWPHFNGKFLKNCRY